MKKNIWLSLGLTIALVIMISACNTEKDDDNWLTEVPELFDVELSVTPEKADPGQAVQIEAKIIQGGELISDADEVIFEIWKKDHKDEAEKTEIKANEAGIYSLEKTFAEDGLYYITSHVTIGQGHNMPTLPIIIGDVPDSELEEDADIPDQHGSM